MNIALHRYWRRSRSVETLIEDWDIEKDPDKFAVDVEELMGECIDLAALAKHAWMALRDNLVSDPNGEMVYESENVAKQAMAKALKSFARVQELVAAAVKQSLAIMSMSAFETAVREIQEINAKVEVVYPAFDPVAAEEARQAFLRGEFITVESLIEELTGETQGGIARAH